MTMTPARARHALPLALTAALVAGGAAAAHAQQQKAAATADPLTEVKVVGRVTASVDRSLEYLASKQNPDGSWHRNNAVNAVALLSFMGRGHAPGRGPYRDVLARGKTFLLASAKADTGYVSFSSMYEHGLATLALAEMYGMDPDPDLEAALRKAVDLIVKSQSPSGGWRYNPVPYDADISVTICQIMALRSARNAGIEIPKETIDKAVEYVRKCQNGDGGFRYQLSQGFSAWPRSAAGVASLYYAGIYQDDAIDRGLDYLTTNALPGGVAGPGAHYFYGHYYAVQTMYLAGGEHWARWWPAIRGQLILAQQTDGSWIDQSVGPVYGTSMALIILQMPKRFLPIFQK